MRLNIIKQQRWMQDFVDRAEDLLQALLAREALPNNGTCVCAEKNLAIWRCRDCTSPPLLCRNCMRHSHSTSQLHNIECWTGSFFRTAYLWEVGVYILVPHHKETEVCESIATQMQILERLQVSKDKEEQVRLCMASYVGTQQEMTAPDIGITTAPALTDTENENEDTENVEEDNAADLEYMKGYLMGDVPRYDALNNHYVRIVHTNGIHHIALLTCNCHGAEAVHADLMYCRLVPTTFSNYRTLFTVAVLDDFRISNLECKASAYQYFQKLRRQTCPMAPARTPNLYQELLRISRVWRWLKKKKWAGHGHMPSKFNQVAPGELANFCPACPQPGINLPADWIHDPLRYM